MKERYYPAQECPTDPSSAHRIWTARTYPLDELMQVLGLRPGSKLISIAHNSLTGEVMVTYEAP